MLYIFFISKAKLKEHVNSFVSYNSYKQLAQLLYDLNLNPEANTKFDRGLKKNEQQVQKQQFTNNKSTCPIARIKNINACRNWSLPDQAFSTKLHEEFVYNKLQITPSALYQKMQTTYHKHLWLVKLIKITLIY